MLKKFVEAVHQARIDRQEGRQALLRTQAQSQATEQVEHAQVTILDQAVVNFDRMRHQLAEKNKILRTQIEHLQEQVRQGEIAIVAAEAGLAEIGIDEALNPQARSILTDFTEQRITAAADELYRHPVFDNDVELTDAIRALSSPDVVGREA